MLKMGRLCYRVKILLAIALGCAPVPAMAQLTGSDAAPGSGCSIQGAVAMSANPAPAGSGAYVLICDGTQWVATISVDTPVADAQVANKEYVDNTLGRKLPLCTNDAAGLCLLEAARSAADPQFTAGNIANGVNILGVTGIMTGSGCTEIGDLCPDNTIFAGYHPTLHVPLYIPPADQGTAAWKSPNNMIDDIATDSIDDGRANSNQVPNSATFAAFKLCKDLALAGKNWYLPSQAELYYLWSIHEQIEAKGNITNFQDTYYWSSTEIDGYGASRQIFSTEFQTNPNKAGSWRVRCVWR